MSEGDPSGVVGLDPNIEDTRDSVKRSEEDSYNTAGDRNSSGNEKHLTVKNGDNRKLLNGSEANDNSKTKPGTEGQSGSANDINGSVSGPAGSGTREGSIDERLSTPKTGDSATINKEQKQKANGHVKEESDKKKRKKKKKKKGGCGDEDAAVKSGKESENPSPSKDNKNKKKGKSDSSEKNREVIAGNQACSNGTDITAEKTTSNIATANEKKVKVLKEKGAKSVKRNINEESKISKDKIADLSNGDTSVKENDKNFDNRVVIAARLDEEVETKLDEEGAVEIKLNEEGAVETKLNEEGAVETKLNEDGAVETNENCVDNELLKEKSASGNVGSLEERVKESDSASDQTTTAERNENEAENGRAILTDEKPVENNDQPTQKEHIPTEHDDQSRQGQGRTTENEGQVTEKDDKLPKNSDHLKQNDEGSIKNNTQPTQNDHTSKETEGQQIQIPSTQNENVGELSASDVKEIENDRDPIIGDHKGQETDCESVQKEHREIEHDGRSIERDRTQVEIDGQQERGPIDNDIQPVVVATQKVAEPGSVDTTDGEDTSSLSLPVNVNVKTNEDHEGENDAQNKNDVDNVKDPRSNEISEVANDKEDDSGVADTSSGDHGVYGAGINNALSDVTKEQLQLQLQEQQEEVTRLQAQAHAHQVRANLLTTTVRAKLRRKEQELRIMKSDHDQQIAAVLSHLLFLEGQMQKEQKEVMEVMQDKDDIIRRQKAAIEDLTAKNDRYFQALKEIQGYSTDNGLVKPQTHIVQQNGNVSIQDHGNKVILRSNKSKNGEKLQSSGHKVRFSAMKDRLRRHQSSLELYQHGSLEPLAEGSLKYGSEENLIGASRILDRKEKCRSLIDYPVSLFDVDEGHSESPDSCFDDAFPTPTISRNDSTSSLIIPGEKSGRVGSSAAYGFHELSKSRSVPHALPTVSENDASPTNLRGRPHSLPSVEMLAKDIVKTTSAATATVASPTSKVSPSPSSILTNSSPPSESNPFKSIKNVFKRKGSKKKRAAAVASGKEQTDALKQHFKKYDMT